MPFDAGAAISKLGLDISGFSGGMLRAQSLMQVFPQSVTTFMASPLLGLINVAKQAGAALVALFQQTADLADNTGDMAEALGVSVEFLSAMGLAAGQSGGSLQGVAETMKFLQKNQADAAKGMKEPLEAFRELGLSIRDTEGRLVRSEDLLLQFADALAAVEDPARRTELALTIAGRGAQSMIPTLIQGSDELRRQMAQFAAYGAVVTAESRRSADAWNDAMGEMRAVWLGFKMVLGETIRDALLPKLQEWLGWFRAHPEEIKAIARSIGQTIANVASSIVGVLAQIQEQLKLTTILAFTLQGALAGGRFGGIGALAGAAAGAATGFGVIKYAESQFDKAKAESQQKINNINFNIEGGQTEESIRNLERHARQAVRENEARQMVDNVRGRGN